jgi:16S rRNA (guanine(966)-N(2))-methyltransferase RsmD
MRIVAGRLKGRRLNGPAGAGVRPTSDGLRETLFNVLGTQVDGTRVLDGFAGTGAVGLEALSRGATRATFVEKDRRALAVIRQNIDACGVAADCDVIPADLLTLGQRGPGLGPFDFVFLDPPYEEPAVDAVVTSAAAWVSPGGILVLEHSKRRASPEQAGALVRYRILQAGDSALSFYSHGLHADTMSTSGR